MVYKITSRRTLSLFRAALTINITTLKEKLEEVEAAKELLGDASEATRQRVIGSFVGTTGNDFVTRALGT
jgi:hypothetical protein